MLKLNPDPLFVADVEITVPGKETGEILQVTFRHKSAEALAAWLKKNWEKSTKAGLTEVIESWTGLVDDKGEQVPYNAKNLDLLLHAYGPAGGELVRAYTRALTESRVKN